MKGFLFDENLPENLIFSPSLPIVHVRAIGAMMNDSAIWAHAKRNDLAIVTKDADFSIRALLNPAPPQVVHLRIGNMRKRDFHNFLGGVWPQIELLLKTHRLVNVYHDRIGAVV